MIIKHQISHCTGNVRKILQKVFFIHVNQMFKFGQPMDTFRRLGAPTPISLNDGLSFNNNNNGYILNFWGK